MRKLILAALSSVTVCRSIYDVYSFDYSAHKLPLYYQTYGNAVELSHKVKLNSEVNRKGGAYVLDAPITFPEIEVEVDFTINSDIDKARGF
jgi:hypothetical protein